jgi:hypothetical protein
MVGAFRGTKKRKNRRGSRAKFALCHGEMKVYRGAIYETQTAGSDAGVVAHVDDFVRGKRVKSC